MILKNILKEIEQTDPKMYEQVSGRRNALKRFCAKVAVAALPVALGSMFEKASAKTTATSTVTGALNAMLEMAYFQFNFYHEANSTGGLIPAADQPGFTTIEKQEEAQLLYLINAITNLGGTPFTPNHYVAGATPDPNYVPAAYDFTGGGSSGPYGFNSVFISYPIFLIAAQVFEDTGIHAINGQIQYLLGDKTNLTTAFQMKTTQARHAAHVRYIRRQLGQAIAPDYPAPWITNNIPPTIALQPFYIGEDNIMQYNSTEDITQMPDTYATGGLVPTVSATAAFDEDNMTQTNIFGTLLAPFLLP